MAGIELAPVKSADIESAMSDKPDDTGPAVKGAHMAWKNLTFSVPVSNGGFLKRGTPETKTILHSMQGEALPGEFLVIMGPSGSGKSSLLNCLSHRTKAFQGDLFLNGTPWQSEYNRICTLVPQDDLFFSCVTVEEHMTFQCILRMDQSIPMAKRFQKKDAILQEFGLWQCKGTVIGDNRDIRGISGGERKRLAVASELITEPPLVLLDEPTSGLDSYMAENITAQLKRLAKSGRTVVATIHQPSTDVFNTFDKVMLLSQGHVAYNGRTSEIVAYFANIGFTCPRLTNPAEFVLESLSMDKDKLEQSQHNIDTIVAAYKSKEIAVLPNSPSKFPMSNKFSSSSIFSRGGKNVKDMGIGQSTFNQAPMSLQVKLLVERTFVQMKRNPVTSKARVGSTMFISLIVGLLYFNVKFNQAGVQNVTGCLFFIVINVTMGSIFPVVQTFPLELPIILRETRNHMYTVTSFYLARMASELVFDFCVPTLFFLISWSLLNISWEPVVFLPVLGNLYLLVICAASFGFLISAISPNPEVALILAPVFILPLMLMGGFFANESAIPVYFSWIERINLFTYAFQNLSIVVWRERDTLDCSDMIGDRCAYPNGDTVLNFLSFDKEDLPTNVACLIGLAGSLRFLAWVMLLYKTRQS